MEKASAIMGAELRCSAKLGEVGLVEARRVSANSILDFNVHCQLWQWMRQGTKKFQMSLLTCFSHFLQIFCFSSICNE